MVEEREQFTDVNTHLASYLRSMACADPGVFRGAKNENFGEFVRRFRRKYERVIACEATLIDILVDDHLAGRAKSIFLAIPRMVKEQGFEATINEMGRLLACDSTASRLRAVKE